MGRDYHITLYRNDRQLPKTRRTVYRDSDDDAIESARRMLRLSRRATVGGNLAYDRWTIQVANQNVGFRIIASGHAED